MMPEQVGAFCKRQVSRSERERVDDTRLKVQTAAPVL